MIVSLHCKCASQSFHRSPRWELVSSFVRPEFDGMPAVWHAQNVKYVIDFKRFIRVDT